MPPLSSVVNATVIPLPNSIFEGGQPRKGSEASPTDEPVKIAPARRPMKQCVIVRP
jgi:hypothetical protein